MGRTLLLLVALGLSAFGCSRGKADEGESAPALPPGDLQAHVRVATVQRGEIPMRLRALGVVIARAQSAATVSSRISGIVSAVEVVDGQQVTAGTVLVRLDAPAVKEALAKATAAATTAEADLHRALDGGLDASQAELDLAAAQADLLARQTRLEAERQEALLKEQLTSEKAATEARQAADAAERASKAAAERARIFKTSGRAAEQARLQAAADQVQADLRTAKLDEESVALRAPQDGCVYRLEATVGKMIERGAVVAQVAAAISAGARVAIAPRDAAGVTVGAPVAVKLDAGRTLSGKVVSVAGAIDLETGLVPVEASLDAAAPLPRIGESVVVEITTATPTRGLLVPVSALSVGDEAAAFVHVVDEKQIAHTTPVRVLARTAASAVVAGEGLREGAEIVVDGNYNLPDGAHVVPDRAR